MKEWCPANGKRLHDGKKEGKYHGEARTKTTKRRFHIIECGTYYTVKKRLGPFWYYIRQGFKKRKFTEFGDVVKFVNQNK